MCLKLCKTVKVKTKDGKVVTLRRPRRSDVKQLQSFINSLVDEDAPILINERATLKGEKEWLKWLLKDIGKNKKHCLVAVYKGEIIGNIELRKGKGRNSHVAEYAIAVKGGCRNIGLATIMSKAILDIGKKDKEIKLIELGVLSVNKPAMQLYKKLGFRQVTRLRKRFKYKEKYIDDIIMDLKGFGIA